MTTDEQEALTIRYRCLYQFAKLRSGNFAIITGEQTNRQVVFIGDSAGVADYLTTIPFEAFIAAPPKVQERTTLTAAEIEELLGDLF